MVSVVLCYKQETAYEMRISDWSSDVCSSDLFVGAGESARANYDTVSGFVIDADDTAGLQGTAFDVLDFGSGVMVNSALLEADGILDGFVQNDSALYDAIQSSTSVLAARSEERRVGTEWVRACDARWAPDREQKTLRT